MCYSWLYFQRECMQFLIEYVQKLLCQSYTIALYTPSRYQFSSVQLLSCVWLFETPWIAARQASLSNTNSRSSLRLTSIESVMPSSHLILCHPLLLLPLIPPSIRVFSNESTLCMRWPKYWSFSFSIIPSKEIPGLISSRKGLQRPKKSYISARSKPHFSSQVSHEYSSHSFQFPPFYLHPPI